MGIPGPVQPPLQRPDMTTLLCVFLSPMPGCLFQLQRTVRRSFVARVGAPNLNTTIRGTRGGFFRDEAREETNTEHGFSPVRCSFVAYSRFLSDQVSHTAQERGVPQAQGLLLRLYSTREAADQASGSYFINFAGTRGIATKPRAVFRKSGFGQALFRVGVATESCCVYIRWVCKDAE